MAKLFICAVLLIAAFVGAQTKKDGTPDMRYKANKQAYGSTYNSTPNYSVPSYNQTPKENNYSNGGELKIQNGYVKKNGTYVAPHLKTTPDNNEWNNLKKSWDVKDK